MWARYFKTKAGSVGTGPKAIPPMSNKWIRTGHRWLSIAFTLAVLANLISMERGRPPAWITYSPLLPLFLLLFTGLYMFAVPYTASLRKPGRS